MQHILTVLNNWFWWEDLWMPRNCSWANFEDHNGYVFPKPQQLFATIPYAFVMLAIRFFLERCFAIPLANILGIKKTRRVKPQPNPTLEAFFKECRKPSQSEIRGLAKKCNWTVHLVEKWFRRRRNLEIPTLHKKFQEACWRFVFYTTSFTAGIIFLYDKPWFHDIWLVWQNYPFHSVLPSQYWYYMLEMSFYWSLLLTLGIDTKRKDFKAHVVHHFAALGLMFCSWSANYIRIGTLVMIVHDFADIWLEAAKMFNYARWENTCSVLFVIFSVAFFITRLVLFPFWILRATLYYPTFYTDVVVPAFFFFNAQLLILQGLHIYWGYLVFNILKKFIFVKVYRHCFIREESNQQWLTQINGHGHASCGIQGSGVQECSGSAVSVVVVNHVIAHYPFQVLRIPIPAWAKISNDKNVKDDRSDEEEEDSFSDAEEEYMKNGHKNGSSHPLLNNNH